MTVLGRDQNHAVGRARAIDRCRCRAFQDLDVLYVIGVDVDHPVWRRGAFELSAHILTANPCPAGIDRIEVRRREGVVGDGNSVDDEERLDVAVKRAKSSNLDARIGTGIPSCLRDKDVRRLARQRLHQIGLVRLLDQIRRHDIAHAAESLDGARSSRAGHHDLAEL